MGISGGGQKRELIIMRHGNTFEAGEPSRRIGAGTDLPLVEKGRKQAAAAAGFLAESGVRFDRIYAAPLLRTTETATIIAGGMGFPSAVIPAGEFIEIHYGVDENKTDADVAERIGRSLLRKEGAAPATPQEAIARGERAVEAWDRDATPPDGWTVDVRGIIRSWRDFAETVRPGETVLVVSSNGIIRFAPHLLAEGYAGFAARQKIKVSPGALCSFHDAGAGWECAYWNTRPQL